MFHKLIKSVYFNCAALFFLLRVYFPKGAAAVCTLCTRLRAIWTTPEEHNFPLQHFLSLWWGWREGFTLKTAYLEMALLYFWPTGNLTLFIRECFFDLVLLRNDEF
jgi:hypothetical protein